MNTNGGFLNDNSIRLLTKTNVKNVSISLDGFADIHDKERSSKGLFDHIVASVKKLNKARQKKGNPSLTIKTVLTDENAEEMPKFRKFCAEELLADTLNISFAKEGNHAQFSMKYHNEIREILMENHCALYSYRIPDRIVQILAELILENRQSRCEVVIYPQMVKRSQIEYFLKNAGKGVYRQCRAPWAIVSVLPNGEVIPCLSVSLGNVSGANYDIMKLLRNGSYNRFLKRISSFGNNVPDACNACCYLRVKQP